MRFLRILLVLVFIIFICVLYIQNQEIVKVDIKQPWKSCYEEALKMDSRFRENDEEQSVTLNYKVMSPST